MSQSIAISLALLKISLIAAQIVFRFVLQPVTEALDLEYWEACLHPGGYR